MTVETGGYPFVPGALLHGDLLDNAFENSSGLLPPQNAIGEGARLGKFWLDISTMPYTLRVCCVTNASLVYVANQWTTLGTLSPGPDGVWTPVTQSTNSILRVAPASGGTLFATPGLGGYQVDPVAALASLNIVLPAGPLDLQTFDISSSVSIGDLIVTAAGGLTVNNGDVVLGDGGGISFRYILGVTTWFRRY